MPNQYTMQDDPPWQDADTLREYWNSDLTNQEIADELGCSMGTLNKWKRKFGIEDRVKQEGPWQDEQKLYDLYWGERLTTHEIADQWDCTQPTVSRWLDKHGIPVRNTSQEHGKTTTTERGYEYFAVDGEMVYIHRLLAVAKYGMENIDRKQVHHKNRIPWDNRPENIEVLSAAEHTDEHRDELNKSRKEKSNSVSASECEQIRKQWDSGETATGIAKDYEYNRATIWNHAVGKCSH